MNLIVNGELREVDPGLTLAGLISQLTEDSRGVAAAVNGEVVPRRAWPSAALAESDRIEVVTAVQGG